MITSTLLIILMIVSCGQNSPLGFTEPESEVTSGSQSDEPSVFSDSLTKYDLVSSSELYLTRENLEIITAPRSGFNPKNGYAAGTDSTNYPVEP